MARNVEIKARVPDAARFAALCQRALALADGPPQTLAQDDAFYRCAQGRLKLRRFDDGAAELIAYTRPDTAGPKTSTYLRTPVANADGLHAALSAACGLIGRVRKQRLLLMAGRTRMHLDEVEGLGCFLELEVVLREGEAAGDGIAEARALMARLSIEPASLVEGAYLDLIASGAGLGG